MEEEKKDHTILWAILGTNIAMIALVITLFTWNRTESRTDYRHHDAILHSIDTEMKDFHGRLCAIEERNKEKK